MRSDKIFYGLNIKDIQTVALDTLERKLTDEEIKEILDPIADRIAWYDAIQNVILSKIDQDTHKRNKEKA
jgi:hypothetical protein